MTTITVEYQLLQGITLEKKPYLISGEIVERGVTFFGDQIVDDTAKQTVFLPERMNPLEESTLPWQRFQTQLLYQCPDLHTGQTFVTLRTKEVKASFTWSPVSMTSV
jgi:hypothetical protein